MRKFIGMLLVLALVLTMTIPVGAYYGHSSSSTPYVVAVVIALVIAGICTLVVWSSMNNVHQQDSASHYTTPGGLRLTGRYERFLRRTRTRHRIQNSDKH